MLTVLLFAQLREQLGRERLVVEAAADIATLIRQLAAEHGEAWQVALAPDDAIVAVNQVIAQRDQCLADGDEVAFFPPTTGG